jgi:hypothetical protein
MHKNLICKTEEMIALGKCRHRCRDTLKRGLKQRCMIMLTGCNWFRLKSADVPTMVSTIMKFRIPQEAWNF